MDWSRALSVLVLVPHSVSQKLGCLSTMSAISCVAQQRGDKAEPDSSCPRLALGSLTACRANSGMLASLTNFRLGAVLSDDEPYQGHSHIHSH